MFSVVTNELFAGLVVPTCRAPVQYCAGAAYADANDDDVDELMTMNMMMMRRRRRRIVMMMASIMCSASALRIA